MISVNSFQFSSWQTWTSQKRSERCNNNLLLMTQKAWLYNSPTFLISNEEKLKKWARNEILSETMSTRTTAFHNLSPHDANYECSNPFCKWFTNGLVTGFAIPIWILIESNLKRLTYERLPVTTAFITTN